MRPRMVVIAGPPGSGKSTFFPVRDLGLDGFNADDRAAALNGGSYQNISLDIRARVDKEFENFVVDHIKTQKGFAIETTLRSDITFRQAQLAKEAGFQIEMVYVCAGDFNWLPASSYRTGILKFWNRKKTLRACCLGNPFPKSRIN